MREIKITVRMSLHIRDKQLAGEGERRDANGTVGGHVNWHSFLRAS